VSRAPALIPTAALAAAVLERVRAPASRRDPARPRRRLMHVVLSLRTGGLERFVADLVRATDPSRFEVEVCCLEDGGELGAELEGAGFQVTALGLSRVAGGEVLRLLVDRMRRGGTDVVHTHNVLAHKFGALAGRCAGVPVVVHTKHGRNFVRRPFEQPKAQVYSHLLSWITDKIVTVSDDAQRVCRRYELVRPGKLLTIANGVDVRRFELEVDRPALRRELDIPADARVVGNVARFVPEKDHETLLRAFARVLAEDRRAFLLLAGDGPLLEPATRLACELGIERRVRFAGRRGDVPRLLQLLDVFVLSSITEGTPISLLEAMAGEVPAVATAVGGNPEVVRDGTTGLLCPPRDPAAIAARILDLLRDEGRARRIAAAAKASVVARYSLDRTAATYESLYDALLGQTPSASFPASA
jgi:glycosyltransferase involved in cell wall biosynthesis